MPPTALSDCPFVAGPMIQRPQCFVGRQSELRILTDLMTGAQPTSVNVVGQRRIGKSSLLYHFFQTWQQRIPPQMGTRYTVIYLNLQGAACSQEAAFYQAVAAALNKNLPKAPKQILPQWLNRPEPIAALWQQEAFDRVSFAQAVRQSKAAGVLPVLCLDEFERLFEHRDQFDDGFYNNLRDLMNDCALMVVTASRRLLDEYRQDYQLTSAFFNLGQCVRLQRFSEAEARTVVQLPDPANPTLTPPHQATALHWGKRHPFLLQLAGQKLWEAQRYGYPLKRAQRAFRQEAQRVQRANRAPRNWPRPLYSLVFLGPGWIGQGLGKGFRGLEWILKLGPVPTIALIALLAAVGVITQPQLTHVLELWQQIKDGLGVQ